MNEKDRKCGEVKVVTKKMPSPCMKGLASFGWLVQKEVLV